MLNVVREGIILEKSDLRFESHSVLNPAVYQNDDTLHMYYRAVRQGNFSSIGYARLQGPIKVVERSDVPVLFSQMDFELHGVEDPRIVKIDDVYYLTYTVYDGINALGYYATSSDLIHFTKQDFIVPKLTFEEFQRLTELKKGLPEKYVRFNKPLNSPDITFSAPNVFIWNKNVVLFPRRIHGKICFFQRIKPEIQLVMVDNLADLTKEFWNDYFMNFSSHVVLSSRHLHEVSYIGAGCPPIETEHGWLVIYHGVCDSVSGYIYSACATLLDLDNPLIEIARLPYPLLSPQNDYELLGAVNNVVFPSGAAIFDERLYFYYGGADEVIACASVDLKGLIDELLMYRNK